MAISALPQSTVRLLGSCITITSSCDLVKELIDNAIDSRATSIEVIISPDSIDKIIVRDDGHGIEVEDFESLGRRSHTSKLTTFEELKTRGGETLGFRGEALAAINSLAALSITTRTKSDPVATRMQLKFGVGGVENTRPISALVGTTVQVSKLFDKLPARKQYVLKNSNKTICEIKDLLRMYALARPCLRLSFKILGDPKHAWSYAPVHSSTIHEAALQIFRRDLVTNCVQVSHKLGSGNLASPQRDIELPSVITIDAFIPGPDCDVKSVKGKGAHISVDFRPVSSTRGFSKRILKIFKSYLTNTVSNQKSSTPLTSPFIQLNIRCPPCSYDPNVTPLKDEIIFSDEPQLLECFESLCQKIYIQKNDVGDESGTTLKDSTSSRNAPCPTTGHSNPGANGSTVPFSSSPVPDFVVSCSAEKLNSVGRLSWPNLPADADTIRPCPPQNQSDKRSYISATMRIKRTVNMARTESNTSDESGVGETVPVQVPPLPSHSEVPSLNSKPKLCPKSLAAKYMSENIERYFHPARNQGFEIAVDETATTGKQPLARDLAQSQSHLERLPLQPLSNSTINEIQGEEESESDIPGSRFRDFRPQVATVNIRVPPTRRGPRLPGSWEVERSHQRTPPNSSPMPRRQLLNSISSPQMIPEFPGIRTPPSSNPSYHERHPNPPFRSHRSNIGAGHDTRPPRNHGNMNDNNVDVNVLRRARISLGRVADGSTMRQEAVRPDASHELVPTEELPRAGREDAPHSISLASYLERHSSQRRAEGFSNASSLIQRTNRNHDISQGYTEGDVPRQPRQYSHMLQTLLMRSPPRTTVKRSAEDAALMEDGPPLIGLDDAPPASTHLTQDSNNNLVSETEVAVDPAHHVTKRQRSRSHHGQPRRHSSRGLPLETTPTDMRIQDVSVDLQLGQGDIGRWEQMFTTWEPYIISGGLEVSLPFRNMDEVRVTETRLRETVNAWVEEMDEDITVEYTIQSTAKGKRYTSKIMPPILGEFEIVTLM
ncbi:DNA mismatch repair protein PMS1 [Cladobotryum mycophilum]|uniref:DNA mismatch repair protein PMS1 n=1 Tax=Cladobotryum mycophilum TaxID=491253 RepID=A0ABR0S5U9_9HYPO